MVCDRPVLDSAAMLPSRGGSSRLGLREIHPMLIRPYQDADQAAVIQLWERAGLTRWWNDPQKDIQRKLSVQPDWFLVGLVDEQIMASVMAGYDGHRGWVNYLAVDPPYRRAGHGRTLMEYVA